MLPKNARFPLQERLHGARFTKTAFFSLRIAHSNQGQSRFGFIVSKQVAKKAVERNNIKRKMAESIRQVLPQMTGTYDMVFVARKEATEASASLLTQTISTVLREQGVLA